MENNWSIRKAENKDAPALTLCMQLAYAPYLARMNGEELPPMGVDYAAEIANYPSWVVASGKRIAGGLIMMLRHDYASIANIAVDPNFQGKGIGGALMKFAESQAKQHKCSELHLATHVLLAENISLYQHFGFQETQRDGNKVLMKKLI